MSTRDSCDGTCCPGAQECAARDWLRALQQIDTIAWQQTGWDAAARDPQDWNQAVDDLTTAHQVSPDDLQWIRRGFEACRAGDPRPAFSAG